VHGHQATLAAALGETGEIDLLVGGCVRGGGALGDALPDLTNFEIARALSQPGCPLCRVLADEEERAMQRFWRDGRFVPAVRLAFFASGGFCPRHAWLLHYQVMRAGRGGALTDLYDSLAARDLGRIDRVLDGSRRRRPSLSEALQSLARRARCRACEELEQTTARKAQFACRLLREQGMLAAYQASEGFCFRHLGEVLAAATEADPPLAELLVDDWRNRLAILRPQLAEFERKRDYRHAHEPRGDEQRAPTDAVRRYAGEPQDDAWVSP
jgi:hypothetical protein